MNVRFGLDIGVASVGWAVVNDDYEVIEAGSNLFESADASKNVDRRNFRQNKRLLRRRHNRIKDFERIWDNLVGEIPDTICHKVVEIRAKALSEKIAVEELYFLLKNMLVHRGISYLEDALDDSKVKGSYAKGILENQKKLEQQKYPCEIQLEKLRKYGKYGKYRGNNPIWDENGEEKILSNVFTIGAYKKEIVKILECQKKYYSFLTDDFVQQYLSVFERKREYYVGPGNELSRTDYGRYTTKINSETGEYITEENIFEKLIGKCSVYPDQMRAAGATYTAQEFNLLNDLNNLTINERKLTKEEKQKIVKEIKTAKAINIHKIIKKAIGEEIETLTGARIDKKEKEIFHSMEAYNKMRREFEKQEWNIGDLGRDELDRIGNILTLNTEKDAILKAIDREKISLSKEMIDCLFEIRRKNSSLFSKWQSFSLCIMQELIPEMYEQPKNQMQLLTDMGIFKKNVGKFQGYSKIPAEIVTQEIYNPVVRRSIRITISIVNALIKKYGYPKEVVIEMPRDRNEEEQKDRIKKTQAKNEKELEDIISRIKRDYGIEITDEMFGNHSRLALKLKLWNEQGEKCLYSGKNIEIFELLNNPQLFEIDHIIPKSISFDDSRSNKVLVYRTENQKKGNLTPYMYLKDETRSWHFDHYMSYVLDLKNRKLISKSKVDKLLFREDITKVDVLKGFIARNINDTRYASRVTLNTMQSFFKAKEAETKVKMIRGSFTSQMRRAMRLEKDREKTYAHHAVDAMLICYSQMGYEAYHEKQSEFIDFEDEKILNQKLWDCNMTEQLYEETIYQNMKYRMKANIMAAEKKVKYWHKIDRKPNRTLCNQTIRGTKDVAGKKMKINKLNIYNSKDYATLLKMIDSGKADRFLMFQNDSKTWRDMCVVLEEYKDSRNAFQEYQKETGDYFRKYSKKHNGPKVLQLKYLDGEVGSCIDISHKYGWERGSRKVILESLKPYRTDVYYHKDQARYYLVGVKYSDLKFEGGHYVLDEEAYRQTLLAEKMITDTQDRKCLERLGYEYGFSLYKNDIIEYEKNGEYYTERFLSRTNPKQSNYIETKPINCATFEKQHLVGLSKTTLVRKIRLDILGRRYYCTQEKFPLEVDSIR